MTNWIAYARYQGVRLVLIIIIGALVAAVIPFAIVAMLLEAALVAMSDAINDVSHLLASIVRNLYRQMVNKRAKWRLS